MAEKYFPAPKSKGKVEIQSLQYIFSSGSAIVEAPVVGDKYYDPNTDRMSFLIGQTEYENITLTGILSKPQFITLRSLYNSAKGKDGSLVATHQIGELVTILTGVRLLRLEYGEFDKASNSAADVKLQISFNGIGSTEDVQRVQGGEGVVVTA
jgi:hypothetical protein